MTAMRGLAAARQCIQYKPSIAHCQGLLCRLSDPRGAHQKRSAHGVYQGLTESRILTPWIVALRNKNSAVEDDQPKASAKHDLAPKLMADSYHEVELPLAREPWLSDTYLNASGHIRLGTIFMDLDALAGIVSYKHAVEPVTVVTAAVDRITIENPPTELCDLVYRGQVTYATGRSSMEVTCKVARAPKDGEKPKDEDVFLTCMFTMVARDPATKKATNLPPLVTSNSKERRLFELGEARSKHKKSLAATTLLQQPPNAQESALIHKMWLRSVEYHDPNNDLRLPSNVHFMSSTRLENTSIMQPQFRNRHQFQVFGGFLMRHAYELAFCCAASFARARPTFVSLDPSRFLNPVPVGSVLYLSAVVAYTDPALVGLDDTDAQATPNGAGGSGTKQTRVQVRVDSKVRNVEHGTSKPTGQFNYTFIVDADVKVMPQTYQEYMMYVDAGRRAREATDERRDGEVDVRAAVAAAGPGAQTDGERITE